MVYETEKQSPVLGFSARPWPIAACVPVLMVNYVQNWDLL